MTEVLIILLLILLNGMFAMAEIAMVASRKSDLELAAKKGGRVAKKALEFSANPGKFFSTVQIGITLIGILLGIYSGKKIEQDFERYLNQIEFLKPFSETLAVTIIVIMLTFLSLVLGELVPKRIGLTMPERISKILAYPMYVISILAAPFIWLLTFTADLLLKLLKIKKPAGSQITEEEIKAIIQEGTESGAVQEIEQDIFENVFHLGDRTIGTLMTPRDTIEWLNIKDPLEVNRLKISTSVHKSFPVCEGSLDHVKGIIDSKDILDALLKKETFEIEQHIRPAIFLTKNTAAFKALETLRKSKQLVAVVVDEMRTVKGILTLNDLIDMLVDDFQQQLHEKKEIVPRSDNSFLIDASLPLAELARYFDIQIANDTKLSQINTVEELAMQFTDKPHVGYEFKWKNLSIEIVDMDGRKTDKVLVKKTT
jgi:putative hemolysin